MAYPTTPNGGLTTETNAQYYAGTQIIQAVDTSLNVGQVIFKTTFNTDLTFGSNDPTNPLYNNNNFRLYTSATGATGTFAEFTGAYTVNNSNITFGAGVAAGTYVVVQLLSRSGGNFGNKDAYGTTVEENYNSYSSIKISELVNKPKKGRTAPRLNTSTKAVNKVIIDKKIIFTKTKEKYLKKPALICLLI